MAPDYWPLPWYLRDSPSVGYFGKVVQTSASLVIVEQTQEAELIQTVGDAYRRSGSYLLRQGVELVLYVRNDLPLSSP
jgi:predicted membrane-bound mannosyltransferase